MRRADLEESFEEELECAAELEEAEATGAKRPNVFLRLYRGQTSFDFIGNRRWWFGVSAVIILIGIISLFAQGLNEGIDFKGGRSWLVSSQNLTVAQATDAAKAAGVASPTVVQLTNQLNGQKQIQVTADLPNIPSDQQQADLYKVQAALAAAAHVPLSAVSLNQVGATWGSNVTKKAIQALIIFFIVVTAYISIRFEFKMAAAAIVAVIHDILVVVGIYSIFQFQVTPDTVVAVLTVLGYSLYDTVVVFDRIRDNAQGLGASGRITYSEMVNLSMNQTLARSINTSLVAIIPVLSVLVIGSGPVGGDHPAELRSGPGHRTDQRGVLVDLHRLAAAGRAEGARAPLRHYPPAHRVPGRRPGPGPHAGHGRGDGRCRRAAAVGVRRRPAAARASSAPARERRSRQAPAASTAGCGDGRQGGWRHRHGVTLLAGLDPTRRKPSAPAPPQGQGEGQEALSAGNTPPAPDGSAFATGPSACPGTV